MPCYNACNFIHLAITSIIQQRFTDWELIVVDDASTDNTVELIKTFHDNRIRLFCLEENKGNYVARNFGLEQARGKYIAMFDADDISLVDRLRIQYDYMERYKHVGCIGSNYGFIDSEGNLVGRMTRHCSYGQFKLRMLLDNYMLQSTIFLRSHLLKKYKIRYKEQYRYASDYHFVFQCSKYFNTHNIPDVLVNYRINLSSITKTKFVEQQQCATKIRLEVFKHYFSEIITSKDIENIDAIFNRYNNTKKIDINEMELLFNQFLAYNYEKNHFHKKGLYDLLYNESIQYLIRAKN